VPSDHPDLDAERIFEVFARHGVEYLLIGGVATRLYGAQRVTYDIDVLAARERENLDRVASALRELGAFLRVGGLDDETARALPVIIDGPALAEMEISTWRTDAGDLDVLAYLRSVDGRRLEFADLLDRSETTVVAGVSVQVAGLDDIIDSKRFADRPKDREAIPELEQLRNDP
jgi:hypothetical protein